VVIDCFADSVRRYRDAYAVVSVDVIRAATTAVTSVSLGRRCFPVPSIEVALPLAARLDHPLLVGELGGNMPYGFDLTNSPAEIASRSDKMRPIILLSSSGTDLMYQAGQCDAAYVACLRNYQATVAHLIGRHQRVAAIGAGTRGEFREEDQFACALVARGLIEAGYSPEDKETAEIVDRWEKAPQDAWHRSKSMEYLRKTAQFADLDFVQEHVNDLPAAFMLKHGEVVLIPVAD
jgi:2-phosphosulfolactate phosphatase